MPTPTAITPAPSLPIRRRPVAAPGADHRLRIVPWVDPVADPHGVHPCSRYVELYWLGIIGPSTTWLLRRLSYGLEMHPAGLDLDLVEMARSLGLGERMGKNSPFRRALQRLCTFELARPHGPGGPGRPHPHPAAALRHLSRLPASLQASHRRWAAEQRLPESEQMTPTGPEAGRWAGGVGSRPRGDRTPAGPLALPSGRRLPGGRADGGARRRFSPARPRGPPG